MARMYGERIEATMRRHDRNYYQDISRFHRRYMLKKVCDTAIAAAMIVAVVVVIHVIGKGW